MNYLRKNQQFKYLSLTMDKTLKYYIQKFLEEMSYDKLIKLLMVKFINNK